MGVKNDSLVVFNVFKNMESKMTHLKNDFLLVLIQTLDVPGSIIKYTCRYYRIKYRTDSAISKFE